MNTLDGNILQALTSVHGVISSVECIRSAFAGDRTAQRRIKRRERILEAGAFRAHRDVLVEFERRVVLWLVAVVARHGLLLVILQLLQV